MAFRGRLPGHTTTVTSIVAKREELEIALAKAEAARDRLEAALAKAEAALVNTVTDAASIDANRTEASAKVDKARARCRQLRAALVNPDHSEFITRSRERISNLATQSGEPPRREPAASPPSMPSRESAVRTEDRGSQGQARRPQSVRRIVHALATAPCVRESIGLFALVLAYLQYNYFDVQLQIMSLASIFP
jgi:hypothetical protein